MRNIIILTFTTLIIISCSTDKKKAFEHYLKAKELFKNDDIKNASFEIDIAISLDRSNLDFQLIKAKIITETDNFQQAINILNDLSNRNYKSDTVNYNLGSCYYKYGKYFTMKYNDENKTNNAYEKALTYYSNAININTQYFDAYIEKQNVLHNLKKHDEALIVINTAIIFFPDSISLIYNRGIEKIFLGDLKGAMFDINKSIQSNKLDSSDFASAYRFRGIIYLDYKGNVGEAIKDLTNAIKYNPKDPYTFVTRAECYKRAGLKDKACEDYRKSADLGWVSLYKTIKEYCNE